MVNLHLLYGGDSNAYIHLITPQATNIDASIEKLSRESFTNLHNFTLSVIKDDPSLLTTVEVLLFLDDWGRTPIAHSHAEKCGVSENDHHMFIQACLEKCPQIFPSFLALPASCQDLIKSSSGLLHFGHLSHIEGGPEMLTRLKSSGILDNNPHGFDFQLLIYICEMSAVYGHIDNRGSKILTDNFFQTIRAIQDTIHNLATHDENDTLKFYLNIRGNWLGLDNENQNTKILARLGALMRLLKPEDGKILTEAYEEISEEQKKIIESELNPCVYRKERTATYMPAVMANLYQAYRAQALSHSESLKKAIQQGATFIAQLLNKYRNNKANRVYDQNIILNFNVVAGKVKTHPELIEKGQYLINEGGIITLTSPIETTEKLG